VAKKEKTSTTKGSILRRFLIMALPFTIAPLLVLLFLYFDLFHGEDQSTVSKPQLEILLGLAAAAAFLGLIQAVRPLFRLLKLSKKLKYFAIHGIDDSQLVEFSDDSGEIGTIAKCFLMVSTKLKDAEQQLEEARLGLRNPKSTLRGALEFTTNFDSQISMILETVVEILGADMGVAISFFETEDYRLVSSVAPKGCTPKKVNEAIDTKLKPLMSEERLIVLPAIGEADRGDLFAPPLIYAPVRNKEGIVGAICLSGHKLRRNFSETEVVHLSDVADWLSAPFDQFKQGKDDQRTFFETLCVMSRVVELRVPHSKGHADRVANYAQGIGEILKLSDEELIVLRDASLLHDLGNLAVPSEILSKPENLDSAERETMMKHPAAGERMVSSLTRYRPLLDPIRHHHELMDGSGSPDRLKGSAISQVTRIITVANILDGLTTEREYRPAFSQEVALGMLKKMVREGKVDKEVVSALSRSLQNGSEDSARIAS
jgi:HD-GYP domain-containing protein (c-di-GMP phosphodiesterase class II)